MLVARYRAREGVVVLAEPVLLFGPALGSVFVTEDSGRSPAERERMPFVAVGYRAAWRSRSELTAALLEALLIPVAPFFESRVTRPSPSPALLLVVLADIDRPVRVVELFDHVGVGLEAVPRDRYTVERR